MGLVHCVLILVRGGTGLGAVHTFYNQSPNQPDQVILHTRGKRCAGVPRCVPQHQKDNTSPPEYYRPTIVNYILK